MAEKNVGALPVVEGSKLVGIFTERDVARTVILRDCLNRPVSDLMTRDVITISPEQDIKECMALITDECVRHLPVLDNGELIGIVSIGDIVKTIIDLQQCTIDSLENYVTGKGYA
jgi:CBS domain-containing protein